MNDKLLVEFVGPINYIHPQSHPLPLSVFQSVLCVILTCGIFDVWNRFHRITGHRFAKQLVQTDEFFVW